MYYWMGKLGIVSGQVITPQDITFRQRILEKSVVVRNDTTTTRAPTALLELAFELVRLREFPAAMPSRFESLFLWDNEGWARQYHNDARYAGAGGKEKMWSSPVPPAPARLTHLSAPPNTKLSCPEVIEVVDPTHPLFGSRIPLLSITTLRGLHRGCLVRLESGVERTLAIEATDLGALPRFPWNSSLSLQALSALLTVYLKVTAVEGEGHVAGPEEIDSRPGVGAPGAAPERGGAGGGGQNLEGGVGR